MFRTKWDRTGSFIHSDPDQNIYRCNTLNIMGGKCCRVAPAIYSHGIMTETYNTACADYCSYGRVHRIGWSFKTKGKPGR